MSELVLIHPDVAAALEAREPVVALETTLVSHGFPAAEGAEVAWECAERIRAAGAVPATVGILDGAVRVGLERAELERFALTDDARKVAPRDLAAAAVQGAIGATTVGGTLAVCRFAGIGFLGTGGLGDLPTLASAHEQGFVDFEAPIGSPSSCRGARRSRSSASSTRQRSCGYAIRAGVSECVGRSYSPRS